MVLSGVGILTVNEAQAAPRKPPAHTAHRRGKVVKTLSKELFLVREVKQPRVVVVLEPERAPAERPAA